METQAAQEDGARWALREPTLDLLVGKKQRRASERERETGEEETMYSLLYIYFSIHSLVTSAHCLTLRA